MVTTNYYSCIHCGKNVDSLYKKYSATVLKLTECTIKMETSQGMFEGCSLPSIMETFQQISEVFTLPQIINVLRQGFFANVPRLRVVREVIVHKIIVEAAGTRQTEECRRLLDDLDSRIKAEEVFQIIPGRGTEEGDLGPSGSMGSWGRHLKTAADGNAWDIGDSVIYVSRIGEWDVPTGSSLDEMIDELEEYGQGGYMEEFTRAGQENYSFKFVCPATGFRKEICKVKGFFF